MSLPDGRRHIAIIGGGCTGVITALNLLKTLPATRATVTIIEPRAVLGAGLAYSSLDGTHRVNVPAEGMTVLEEEPGAFLAWLRETGRLADDPAIQDEEGNHYPRRALFGAYLDQLIRRVAAEPGRAVFRHVQAAALTVSRAGTGYDIMASNGALLHADLVVLAVSHPPPAIPAPFGALAGAPGFFANPWDGVLGARIGRHDRVLLIGTALTAMDVVASLSAHGHEGEIIAISRRGLVSRGWCRRTDEKLGDFGSAPNQTALGLLRQVKAALRHAKTVGLGPEAVLLSLRTQNQKIWAGLMPEERLRFLRHLRVFWDAHRYRTAPQVGNVAARRRAEGSFTPLAARALAAGVQHGRLYVTLQPRGGQAPSDELFDAVVNCTGPDHRNVTVTNPALAGLAAQGLIRADDYGLGLETDEAANALNAQGGKVADLFVAGPLARGRFGEITGLSQVMCHAAFVAGQVAALCEEQLAGAA